MIKYPEKIIIKDGAFALDGGSTFLEGFDADGNEISISLSWSIENQRKGKCQLFFNEFSIEKRSVDETNLLNLLSKASYQVEDDKGEPLSSENQRNNNQLILGDDIQNVFNGIDQGPEEGLKSMTGEIIKKVLSENYLKPVKEKTLEEVLEEAKEAFTSKKWGEVVEILEPIEIVLTKEQKNILNVARENIK